MWLFPSPAAAYCSVNDPPKNGGVINRARDRPGSRLQYYCNAGYRLVGHRNATCRLHPNGLYQWDNLAPLCQGKSHYSDTFTDSVPSFRCLGIALKRRPASTHMTKCVILRVAQKHLRTPRREAAFIPLNTSVEDCAMRSRVSFVPMS